MKLLAKGSSQRHNLRIFRVGEVDVVPIGEGVNRATGGITCVVVQFHALDLIPEEGRREGERK